MEEIENVGIYAMFQIALCSLHNRPFLGESHQRGLQLADMLRPHWR